MYFITPSQSHCQRNVHYRPEKTLPDSSEILAWVSGDSTYETNNFYLLQEQGNTLDVTFECRNGKQKCSQHILRIMSDFYNDQLNALVRFENPTVFTVNFSVECVRAYLDALHGIRAENASIATTLELIKFLKDLARGKSVSLSFIFLN